MVVTRINIKKIFKNESSNNVGIFAVPLDTDDLDVDSRFKTVKINGEFILHYGEKSIREGGVVTVTLSDLPNSSGYYRLIYPGMLPNKNTMKNYSAFLKYFCKPSEYINLDKLDCKGESFWKIIRLTDTNSVTSVFNKLNKNNVSLKEVKLDIKRLSKVYSEQKSIFDFTISLEKMGVTNKEEQLSIYMSFKGQKLSEVATLLKENPYILTSKSSMKLDVIDNIALKMGVLAKDDRRVAAIVEYNLEKIGATGKTWVYVDALVSMSVSGNSDYSLYNLNTNDYSFDSISLKEQLIKIAESNYLWLSNDKKRIASMTYYEMEKELFEIITNLNKVDGDHIFNKDSISKAISVCEKREKIKYSKEQKESVVTTFRESVAIIAGPAGTGKSTIARAVTEVYRGDTILATALAGKAVLRLMETTGTEGRTMHSYLARLSGQYFEADLIVIDEGSMLGLEIVLQFFKKIKPGTKVIILGDDSQLTPIGAGNVFADLLHSSAIISSHLTVVHRQALESNIIKFATIVRTQQLIDVNNNPFKHEFDDFKLLLKDSDVGISRAITKEFKGLISKYSLDEIMIVTPYKTRGSVNTFDINNRMQKILLESNKINPNKFRWLSLEEDSEKKFIICEGDRVINTQNNYNCKTQQGEKLPVMNGSLGTVVKIDKFKVLIDFDGIGTVEFLSYDLRNILLGYAISVHKSQGSQAKAVIYALPQDVGRLGCCEQVYTAITRSRDVGIVIACIESLNQCILTKELSTKQTLLKEFLDEFKAISSFATKYKPKRNKGSKTSGDTLNIYKDFGKSQKSKNKKFPEVEVVIIDDRLREKYDKNNARRKVARRNDNLLSEREQAKVDNMILVQNLAASGKKNKEIVDLTSLTKGTVSKYMNIDVDEYIKEQIKKAKIKK